MPSKVHEILLVLAVEPLGRGHIHCTQRRVKDGRKTRLITYLEMVERFF